MDVIFDEGIFPFEKLNANAVWHLQTEINLLNPTLLNPIPGDNYTGDHVTSYPNATVNCGEETGQIQYLAPDSASANQVALGDTETGVDLVNRTHSGPDPAVVLPLISATPVIEHHLEIPSPVLGGAMRHPSFPYWQLKQRQHQHPLPCQHQHLIQCQALSPNLCQGLDHLRHHALQPDCSMVYLRGKFIHMAIYLMENLVCSHIQENHNIWMRP
jgi:hypothetical protein